MARQLDIAKVCATAVQVHVKGVCTHDACVHCSLARAAATNFQPQFYHNGNMRVIERDGRPRKVGLRT
eukprot:IDg5081t1